MSGIELASAILGILAVGAKVTTCLFDLSQTLANTPESIKTTLITVKETSLILKQLELYINQVHSVSDDIRSLLSIDHLSETLTGCVLTHSELEKHLDFVNGSDQDVSMFDRGKWLLREKEIKSVVTRLEGHKSTFTLILQILQCHSMQRAQETLERLSKHMENNATKDAVLQAHLQQYRLHATQNERFDSQSVRSVDLNSILPDADDTATITSIDKSGSTLTKKSPNTRRSLLKYEKLLESSWVYRRIDFSWSKTSILSRSRSERGMNPSILSKETWDTISNIAVYRLPIEASGVYNSHRYEPMTFENPSGTLPTLEVEIEGLPIVDSPQSTSKTTYTPPRSPTEIFAPTEKADKRERRPINPINLAFIFPPKLSIELGRLEFPNPHFVYQAGLFKILSRTIKNKKSTDRRTSAVVLWGRPGYGKTETVLNFLATKFSLRDPDLPRIWVQASTKDQIVQAYSKLAKQMGLVSEESTDQRDHANGLCVWFKTTQLRWLLILDNVPNLDMILDFVPQWSSGTVIITTRDRPKDRNHIHNYMPYWKFERLKILSEKQAIMIVESYFKGKETDIENEAVKLAEKVGFVPIGLQAAIKYIQEQTVSLKIFNQRWTSTEAFLSMCKVGHGYRVSTEGYYASANNLYTNQQLSKIWQEDFSLANTYRRPVVLNNLSSGPRPTISEGFTAIFTWFDIKTINFQSLSTMLRSFPFKNLSPNPPVSQVEAAQYMVGEFLALSNHASNYNVDKLAQISCAMAFSPEARSKSLDLVCSVILPDILTTIDGRVEGIDFIDCVTTLNERFTGLAKNFNPSLTPPSFVLALKDAIVLSRYSGCVENFILLQKTLDWLEYCFPPLEGLTALRQTRRSRQIRNILYGDPLDTDNQQSNKIHSRFPIYHKIRSTAAEIPYFTNVSEYLYMANGYKVSASLNDDMNIDAVIIFPNDGTSSKYSQIATDIWSFPSVYHFNQAKLSIAQGDFGEAKVKLEFFLGINQEFERVPTVGIGATSMIIGEAHYLLGSIHLIGGLYSLSIAQTKEAGKYFAKCPRDSNILMAFVGANLGLAYAKLGEYDLAVESLKTAQISFAQSLPHRNFWASSNLLGIFDTLSKVYNAAGNIIMGRNYEELAADWRKSLCADGTGSQELDVPNGYEIKYWELPEWLIDWESIQDVNAFLDGTGDSDIESEDASEIDPSLCFRYS